LEVGSSERVGLPRNIMLMLQYSSY